MKKDKKISVGIALPILNEEKTIARTIEIIKSCGNLVDQVIVIDSGSSDNSLEIIKELGVPVIKDAKAAKDLKTSLKTGKGWNLWSSIYYLNTDIIAWIDSDIKNINKRFIIGIVGPLITDNKLKFVKGYYHRPKNDSRVTEIMVRPLISFLFPRLKNFIQPLSGEYAGRRDFLEKIYFFSGYSVESAVLIQAVYDLKSNQIAQSYLGVRIHKLQSVQSLGKMSASILYTLLKIANNKNIIKLNCDIRGYLRQFNSKSGAIFSPVDFCVKDKSLSPLIDNKEYENKFQ